jgi:hypothetical protein
VLNKIKSTVGSGVIVYASASPDRPTSSTCTIETSASRANVKSITNSLISQGLVKAGPVMTTLTNAQTGDGCHASTEGECIWGKDLAEFFDQNLETTTCNNNTTQNKDDKKPGTNPCGDGICDETERSSGKCPTDCNK